MRIKLMPAILAVLILVVVFHGESLAQCSDGVENGLDDHPVSFGNYVNGTLIKMAQSFILDCDAQILSVGVRLSIHTVTNLETLPLAVGDSIQCDIIDENGSITIMTEYLILDSDASYQNLEFDFSSNQFKIEAGVYNFRISLPQQRWAYLVEGADYVDGIGYYTVNGSWIARVNDWKFNIQWDAGSAFVKNDDTRWGDIKACFR